MSEAADLAVTAPPSEGVQEDWRVTFEVLLAARRETFLARYPRFMKLGVTGFLLIALVAMVTIAGKDGSHDKDKHDAKLFALNTKASHSKELPTPPPTIKRNTEYREPRTDAEKQAAAANDAADHTARMATVPDHGLLEESPSGPLPKVGVDGRRPWQIYARPFNTQDPRPRIALVMADLGFSRVATDSALRRLPPAATLAFDAQGTATSEWLARARADGYETLLSLPMEPFDYPRSDPGPNALLTTLPNSDNLQRLLGNLRKGTGYVGITTMSGSRFAADANKLEPVLEVMRERGLLVLDSHIALHSVVYDLARKEKVPVAVSSSKVDATPTPQDIDAALTQLEATARVEGVAVGMLSPLPVTLDRVELWAKQLASRGFVLAPLSAVVE